MTGCAGVRRMSRGEGNEPMIPNRRAAILRVMVLGALLALPGQGAHASKIATVEFTCPIGGAKFKQMMALSGTQSGRRLDTRPYGRIRSPSPLPKCKSNGFVVYQDEFTAEELAKLKPIVRSRAYQDLRKKHRSYYLAAYLRERMGAAKLELGLTYLKASWQAEGAWSPDRDADTPPAKNMLADEYRLLALQKLDSHLAASGDRSAQWWNAAIIAAELERLLGRFPQAETRLVGLSAGAANASPGQLRAIAQIRAHAASGNARPQALAPAPAAP